MSKTNTLVAFATAVILGFTSAEVAAQGDDARVTVWGIFSDTVRRVIPEKLLENLLVMDGDVSENPAQSQAATSSDAEVEESIAPIPAEWLTAFEAVRPDPHPEKLTRNCHYWISDEKRHDVFRTAIENSGGVFIGLGTDQNYLMAAWAKPEVLIPLDFDQMIIDLHFAFRVIFLHAQTSKEFVRMWNPEAVPRVARLIAEAYDEELFRKRVLRAYKKGRKHVAVRLKRVRRIYGRLKMKTFLTDPEQYDFLVQLFRANRVFPVRGDLTADTTVRDVADAARRVGLPIRTLYLSNAEQYFKFTPDYLQNMKSLPFDEKSVVIRTVGKKTNASPDGVYEYIYQGGQNFAAWLDYPKLYTVWTLFHARDPRKGVGSTEITRLPPTIN